MLRWPLMLYEPARTRLVTAVVVAAVGAWREPVTKREQIRVVAADQRQSLGLVAGDGLAAFAGFGFNLQRDVADFDGGRGGRPTFKCQIDALTAGHGDGDVFGLGWGEARCLGLDGVNADTQVTGLRSRRSCRRRLA